MTAKGAPAHQLSALDIAAGLRAGDFSSVEITRALLDRIEQLNPSLNAIVTPLPERALAQAQAADKRLAEQAGKAGANDKNTPLLGVPLIHKDIFCTEGVRTTCGSRMLADWQPPYSATVVEKLAAAGAVTLGKANMDEFAMGSSNETSHFGPVHNPWQLNCVPGGSSGGSAAAVAAGLAPLATGTDTGGSIRQPAAFCGLTGIKPTYGRVSRWGMIAFASSLDQAGVFARDAADSALMLQCMAGFDERDSTSLDEALPDFSADLDKDLKGLRLGVPEQYLQDLDGQVLRAFEQCLDSLRSLGASISTVQLPHAHLGLACYYIIAPAECSSNLARYDGVRFGHRCDNPKDLQDLYRRSRSEGFGLEVKRRIMMGTHVLSSGYYEAYYLKALRCRRLVRQDFVAALSEVDALVSPTTIGPAFVAGARSDDPVAMYKEDLLTLGVNLAGLPAISLPGGASDDGLPLGLQIIAGNLEESLLFRIAQQFQQATDWHQKRPELAQ